MGTILGALFLFMFRYVFGGAIDTGGGVDYVDFLVPGFLVTTILWTGMSAAAGVAEDAASGVYDRLRSLPIPRSAVMVGRSLADTRADRLGHARHGRPRLRCRLPHPRRRRLGPRRGFALILVAGYAFTWVFITIGLVAGNAQAAQGMSMLVVIPLTFVSSANVPSRLDARLDAAVRRQPAGQRDHQRRAQPDAGRYRCRRRRPHHELLGRPQPGLVRRHRPRCSAAWPSAFARTR